MILYSIFWRLGWLLGRRFVRLSLVLVFLFPVGGAPVVSLLLQPTVSPPVVAPASAIAFIVFSIALLVSIRSFTLIAIVSTFEGSLREGQRIPEIPEAVALDTMAIAREKVDNVLLPLPELRALFGVCDDLRVVGPRNDCAIGNGEIRDFP